ncbi:MAG: hypothetical protein J0H11_04615 [Rhizobiales bacterium]|nr:hypothetical protein [Hyphomicrobiales bacterium]
MSDASGSSGVPEPSGAPKPVGARKTGAGKTGAGKTGASKARKPQSPGKQASSAKSRGTAAKASARPSGPPRLDWRTPALFALLAPPLFMLLDMSLEQATGGGFSPSRLASWIAEDSFYALRAVYLAGVIPAAFAGLLIARRDQRGGASPLFALVLFALFALPFAILFARNLFIFAPPPFGESVLIGVRVVAAVVISGFVCYAGSRWLIRTRR